jgi:alpha-beta hydrolase superfamily lysophospholipase
MVTIVTVAVVCIGPAWILGSVESAPAPASIGAPPADLPAEAVSIASGSGSELSGWYVPGEPHGGVVVLMHGIRKNRLAMLGRAELLHRAGFSVLLFDFQAHGESPGRAITFGYLEAKDARAAFDFARRRAPGERIGVIGVSLGGAAAVLSDPPLDAAATVLEGVYGSFDQALEDRLLLWFGPIGRFLSPLLIWQVQPRLGFDPATLAPAARIADLHAAIFIIGGDADEKATLDETHLLYRNANEPKLIWIVPGARHVDFQRYVPDEYQRRVVDFLKTRLRG